MAVERKAASVGCCGVPFMVLESKSLPLPEAGLAAVGMVLGLPEPLTTPGEAPMGLAPALASNAPAAGLPFAGALEAAAVVERGWLLQPAGVDDRFVER